MSYVVGFAVLCSCSRVDHATFNIFKHVPMSPSVIRRVHHPQIHAAHQTHSPRAHTLDTRSAQRLGRTFVLRAVPFDLRPAPPLRRKRRARREKRRLFRTRQRRRRTARRGVSSVGCRRKRQRKRLQRKRPTSLKQPRCEPCAHTCPERIAERMPRDANALLLTHTSRASSQTRLQPRPLILHHGPWTAT
jgi:hypothetical protein